MAHPEAVSLILATLRLSAGVISASDLDLGRLTLVTAIVERMDLDLLSELGTVLENGHVQGELADRRFLLAVRTM